MICLISFFSVSSFSLVSPILSLYAKDFAKATIFEVGIITSAFFVASTSVKIPLGILGGGRRTPFTFALSLLLLMILPYSYTLAETSIGLALVRMAHGVAFALSVTVSLILTPLTVPEQVRNRAVATYSVVTGIGLVTGSAAGTLSVVVWGLRSGFYVASGLAAPGFILGYEFTRRLYSIEKRWMLLNRPIKIDLYGKVCRVIKNKIFLASFFACLAYFFTFGAVLAYVPLYASQNLQLPYYSIAAIFFGCYAATTVTRLPLNSLISKRRFSKEMLMFSAQVLSVALISYACLAAHQTLFALAIVLFGVPQGIIYPVGAMIASESVSPSEHVLANSLYLVAWDLGLALGPALTSTIASTSGILSALAASSTLPAFSAATILYILIVKARNRA